MSKLPRSLSGMAIARALARLGFQRVRQTGSHLILRRDVPFAQVTVPAHGEVRVGTLANILTDAGLTIEQFLGAL